MRTAAQTVRIHPGQSIALSLLASAFVAYVCLLGVLGAERAGLEAGLLLATSALLGAAFGVAIAATFERSWRLVPEDWGQRGSLLFVASLPLCWAGFVFLPPVPQSVGFVAGGLGTTAFLLGICALPGVLLGAAIAVSAVDAACVTPRSASQRLGAACGCMLVPVLLYETGAGGLLVATAALGLAGAVASAPMEALGRTLVVAFAVAAGLFLDRIDARLPVPGLRDSVDLGPVAADPSLPEATWNCGGRVEVAALRPALVLLPAAPMAEGVEVASAPATATVRRWWIATRGRRGAEMFDHGRANGAPLPESTTWRTLGIRLAAGPRKKACVLGLAGGTEVHALRATEAASIVVVEPDAAVPLVHERLLGAHSVLAADARLQLVRDGLRASLSRFEERFDLIVHNEPMPAIGDDAPSGSDLERLQLSTVDAFRAATDRLVDGGLLQWSFRGTTADAMQILHALHGALPEDRREAFPGSVAVLHDAADDAMVVLFCKGGFGTESAERLRALANAATLDAVALPDGGLRAEVTERRDELAALDREVARLEREISIRTEGVDDAEIARLRNELGKALAPRALLQLRCDLAEFVLAGQKDEFAEARGLPLRPATDDRPFAGLGTERSFGGPRFLLAVVAALGIAFFAMLVPLLWRGGAVGTSRQGALRYLVVFAGIGFAGIAVATGLLQKFLPLLGSPGESIAVVLGSLLLATACGAGFSHSLLNWEPQRGRYVAFALLATCGLAAFATPFVVDLCAGLGPIGRVVAVAVVTTPVGLCLGTVLPHGVRVLAGDNPDLVAWAYVVTAAGAATAPMLGVVVAGQVGFSLTLLLGGVAGAVSLLLLDGPAHRVVPQSVEEAPVEDYGAEVEGEATA